MYTSSAMGLKIFNLDDDNYDHDQVASNWAAVDQHRHVAGEGLQVPTGGIEDGAVTTNKIADGAVTTAKIADGAVTASKISLGALGTSLFTTGDLKLGAYDTPDSGWALCDGSSHSTSDSTYATLFAKIQYKFGGSGSNFSLPDYRGRAVVGAGSGPGLTARIVGAEFGSETHQNNVPSLIIPPITVAVAVPAVNIAVNPHTHPLSANGGASIHVGVGNIFAGVSGLAVTASQGGPLETFSGTNYVSGANGFFNGSGWPQALQTTGLVGNTDNGIAGGVTAPASAFGGTGIGATSPALSDPGSSIQPSTAVNIFIKL